MLTRRHRTIVTNCSKWVAVHESCSYGYAAITENVICMDVSSAATVFKSISGHHNEKDLESVSAT